MTFDLIWTLLAWLLVPGWYFLDKLFIRHGDRSFVNKRNTLMQSLESHAAILTALILYAIYHTVKLVDPPIDFNLAHFLLVDFIFLAVLALYWKTVPELPSWLVHKYLERQEESQEESLSESPVNGA